LLVLSAYEVKIIAAYLKGFWTFLDFSGQNFWKAIGFALI